MPALLRSAALALTAIALTATALDAEARRYGRGGGYHSHYQHPGWSHGGRYWSGVGIGIGLGLAGSGLYYYGPPRYPAYVVTVPATPAYPTHDVPDVPPPSTPAEPIIYPRDGQSGAQIEADRQACNRWAMTQPSAVADASVFHRATLACMEGRGYTVR